jgi:tetratricopeptide (TPR) repeat protein
MTQRPLLTPIAATVMYCLSPIAVGESITECRDLFRTGQYEDCLQATTEAIEGRSYGEEWPMLKTQSELATGRYDDAVATVAAGLERYSWSVRLLMLQHECAVATGQKELADKSLAEIERLVQTASWRYTDADDLVSLGHAALALGADPRDVQEGFFDRARRNFATRPDGFLAAGQLAAAKGDFQFAAEILGPAAEKFDDNPDVLLAYSIAVRSADSEQASELLKQVLEVNSHHAGALQQIVERQIDQEDYAAASKTIQTMLSINSQSPTAHALQAVVHHMQNDIDAANTSSAAAMEHSGPSAAVNHLIGRKLSQKYRFREGSQYQRDALEADSEFQDARIQLAQDLLRLGEEAEGWQLAEAAHEADGYNTTVFNLLQLRGSLEKFTTLETLHFRLRLEQHESAVYGQRASELLEEAWQTLSERYEYVPVEPVVVEIYPRAEDFAVRTFGIPDVAGFLGVCFGKVITANSPATRKGSPSNWESVLWHEFCHVITLQMTDNRIPRWLSEGISVYEERRRDKRWGQHMDATFRDRILDGRITPMSELSSAFLTAENGEDLNFAYYESSMVVEFLVERFGLQSLIGVLHDLKSGLTINDALQRQTVEITALDETFAEYLHDEAMKWAPKASFDPATVAALVSADTTTLKEFVVASPGNYPAALLLAARLSDDEKFTEAEEILEQLIEMVPEDDNLQGPRPMLAGLYRKQQRTEDEQRVLKEHTDRNADDLSAFVRLQHLASEATDWSDVVQYGNAVRAIDPFQIQAVVQMAAAAESSGDADSAESALNSLIVLLPDDAARFHFRIATLLQESQPQAARRHVLLALEHAPRFRAAHRLLLVLHEAAETDDVAPEESIQ